jgi:hypothetical protein
LLTFKRLSGQSYPQRDELQVQSFILKSLDIEIFLELLEKFYASKFKRIARTDSMIFAVFIHERFFKSIPSDLTLTVVLEYNAISNIATVYGIASGGGARWGGWEGGSHDYTERYFVAEIRKIAADYQWKVELGPDRRALTCPHCNAQYVYSTETAQAVSEDYVQCQNCSKMFLV